MTAAMPFTDEELLAYIDERLPPARATEVERLLRSGGPVQDRLIDILRSAEQGEVTLGGMWRRGRWSCPPRAVWAAFVSGRLGDGMSQYLQFHLETAGCRLCEASVRDLRQRDGADTEDRVRKIFQSSAGALHGRRE
jgi:hypothetical protein